MSISKRQLALLWTAKTKLCLPDETFRTALVQLCGVTSTKELDRDGFETLMGFFEHIGFAPSKPIGASYGERSGMASFAQLELIRQLWHEYTRHMAGEDELNKWLRSKWHVDSLRFVTKDQAQKMIGALKAMKARAA